MINRYISINHHHIYIILQSSSSIYSITASTNPTICESNYCMLSNHATVNPSIYQSTLIFYLPTQ